MTDRGGRVRLQVGYGIDPLAEPDHRAVVDGASEIAAADACRGELRSTRDAAEVAAGALHVVRFGHSSSVAGR